MTKNIIILMNGEMSPMTICPVCYSDEGIAICPFVNFLQGHSLLYLSCSPIQNYAYEGIKFITLTVTHNSRQEISNCIQLGQSLSVTSE